MLRSTVDDSFPSDLISGSLAGQAGMEQAEGHFACFLWKWPKNACFSAFLTSGKAAATSWVASPTCGKAAAMSWVAFPTWGNVADTGRLRFWTWGKGSDAAREFSTDFALATPGVVAGFKVYVVLTTGNERGSDPVYVTRP